MLSIFRKLSATARLRDRDAASYDPRHSGDVPTRPFGMGSYFEFESSVMMTPGCP
jgi:hypothetical protein